jgi:hypothetical protein
MTTSGATRKQREGKVSNPTQLQELVPPRSMQGLPGGLVGGAVPVGGVVLGGGVVVGGGAPWAISQATTASDMAMEPNRGSVLFITSLGG